jgi:hypothetical protein
VGAKNLIPGIAPPILMEQYIFKINNKNEDLKACFQKNRDIIHESFCSMTWREKDLRDTLQIERTVT